MRPINLLPSNHSHGMSLFVIEACSSVDLLFRRRVFAEENMKFL